MSVTYGADYSAGELSPSELDSFTGYDIRFLIRYIGWPNDAKCISHYPGAYGTHVKAGRTVLLVAEYDTNDPAGGYAGGVAMARRAAQDAGSIGYPASLPIFFCADGWLASSNISIATAMSYLDGAASVMGRQRTGAYGFRDFIEPAKQGGHARWLWLAGQAPSDSELAAGWPHFYQWNNGMINPGGIEADLDWAYPGVLGALHAGASPGPASGPASAPGRAPAWPLPPEQYFGLVTGPAACHGGINATERGWVRLIQQALIRKGFVPGISDPGSAWADGIYEEPTREAVLRFQRSAGYLQTGNVWPDDWARLLS
jgi:Rv2525c-like, glycoside hydrolase-like domain/Putative peptidoglycan binding domain